jgi:hypothetical protein
MKANVLHIVSGHLDTLKNPGEKRYHRPDVLLFFGLPALLVIGGVILAKPLKPDVYGVSISVFSIFSALLLNVQIALFSVYQRGWQKSGDDITDSVLIQKNADRRDLLGELNTNISYLILISCVGVTLFLIFYIFDVGEKIELSISIFLYAHFLLTLLMVIKRAHAIFQKEYQID